MKGVIFNELQELVEETFGYEVWDEVILQTMLPSEGVYTASATYEDQELFDIVAALSQKTGISQPELVKIYGTYLFKTLMKSAPQEAKDAANLRRFLMMLENLIHVEVRKLFKEVNLPQFGYREDDDILTMLYTSPRKLCHLSEGLILGAAQHFSEEIELSHPVCMHEGHEHCQLQIKFL